MSTLKIPAILDFTIPGGMRTMTTEENARFFPRKDEESYGIRNDDEHTIFVINYKRRPILIGRAATEESVLKLTEKNIRKQIPTYVNTGYGKRMVDGKEILTFSFRFTGPTGTQMAEYGLYRASGYFCVFQCMYAEENRDYAEAKYEEFLSTVKFKD